jgi:hypothetical protein
MGIRLAIFMAPEDPIFLCPKHLFRSLKKIVACLFEPVPEVLRKAYRLMLGSPSSNASLCTHSSGASDSELGNVDRFSPKGVGGCS